MSTWLFGFLFLFHFSFFSFSYLFVAVIDLLLGLLPIQIIQFQFQFIISKKAPLTQAMFTYTVSVVAHNCSASFSLKFLSYFMHISGFIEPITLVSLDRSLPPAEA